MTEQSSYPEQHEQGPEYEIDKLVALNELAQELYDAATGVPSESLSPSDASDAILDVIQELALAMVRRQGPEFGQALYAKLWERADNEGQDEGKWPRAREAEQHRNLAIAVDRQLFDMGVGLGSPDESPEETPEQ